MENYRGYKVPIEVRFWNRVRKTELCWLWDRTDRTTGYGKIGLKKENKWIQALVHRVSYEMAKGLIPKGYDIDHICRNRGCVNPDHLEAVTRKENLLRGRLWRKQNPGKLIFQVDKKILVTKDKTKCFNGHLYEEGSFKLNKKGYKECRICIRKYVRKSAIRRNPNRGKPSGSQINSMKTHCRHGHEYSQENTWRDKKGTRFCRTCNRTRNKKIK